MRFRFLLLFLFLSLSFLPWSFLSLNFSRSSFLPLPSSVCLLLLLLLLLPLLLLLLLIFLLLPAGWAEGKVVTVPPTAPAIEALAAMRRAGVAGLAVVEGGGPSSSAPAAAAAAEGTGDAAAAAAASPPSASGAMIGSFAVPDLRALVCEHLGSLALPVGEALAKARGREFWGVARGGNGSCNGAGGERSGGATPVGSFGGRGGASLTAPLASSFSAVGTPTLYGTSPRDAGAAAAAARRASIGGRVGQALATASPDDSFSVILARLVARRVHRLHVIDDETSAPLVRLDSLSFFPLFGGLVFSSEAERSRKGENLLFLFQPLSQPPKTKNPSPSKNQGVVTLTDALGAVLAAAEKEEDDKKKKEEDDKKAAAKAALV